MRGDAVVAVRTGLPVGRLNLLLVFALNNWQGLLSIFLYELC